MTLALVVSGTADFIWLAAGPGLASALVYFILTKSGAPGWVFTIAHDPMKLLGTLLLVGFSALMAGVTCLLFAPIELRRLPERTRRMYHREMQHDSLRGAVMRRSSPNAAALTKAK